MADGPVCYRCFAKLNKKKQKKINQLFEHTQKQYLQHTSKLKRRALKLSELFPTMYVCRPDAVILKTTSVSVLPELPHEDPSSIHRRRTNKACVKRLSCLLTDHTVTESRRLCSSFLQKLPVDLFHQLAQITTKLWSLLCEHLPAHIKYLNYQFNYHTLIVLYHAVFGVYILKHDCQHSHSHRSGFPAINQKDFDSCPTRYVNVIQVIPPTFMLSACLPYAQHLDQFKFSLATTGEAHGLFRSALEYVYSHIESSNIFPSTCIDLYTIPHNTVILNFKP